MEYRLNKELLFSTLMHWDSFLKRTELLDDPLKKEKHSVVREFSQIYLGVLNDYDLIASKLFRGTTVDFEDSLHLASAHRRTLDRERLKEHFFELLAYHSVGESRVRSNWDSFERRLKELK